MHVQINYDLIFSFDLLNKLGIFADHAKNLSNFCGVKRVFIEKINARYERSDSIIFFVFYQLSDLRPSLYIFYVKPGSTYHSSV